MKRAESVFRRMSLHFEFVKLMASKTYAQYSNWGFYNISMYALSFLSAVVLLALLSNFLSPTSLEFVQAYPDLFTAAFLILPLILGFSLRLFLSVFLYPVLFFVFGFLDFFGLKKKYDLFVISDNNLKKSSGKYFKIFKKEQVSLKIDFSEEHHEFLIMKHDHQDNFFVFIKKTLMTQISYETLQLNLKNQLEKLIQIELEKLDDLQPKQQEFLLKSD